MDPQPNSIFTSRGDFQAAIRQAVREAAARGARQLWLMDPTFADWPLSDPAVIEGLAGWAAPHRRLTLVAGTYDDLSRRHAKWAEWRRHWSHMVDCRCNPEIEIDRIPTVLLVADTCCVRLMDREHYRGTSSTATVDQVRAREAIDAVLQRSEEAFPVTTLGL